MQAEKAKHSQSEPSDAKPSGADDPKKAAIAAALARKQNSNLQGSSTDQATSAAPEKSLDELKQALEKAQIKLDKMIDALEDAKANAPDNVAKLQRAVEKNQLRVNQAKQSVEKAQQDAGKGQLKVSEEASASAPKPSLDELKINIEKAQNKLDKMTEALEDAKINTPDTVEKLQRAVDKNKVRVAAAKDVYDRALNQQRETN